MVTSFVSSFDWKILYVGFYVDVYFIYCIVSFDKATTIPIYAVILSVWKQVCMKNTFPCLNFISLVISNYCVNHFCNLNWLTNLNAGVSISFCSVLMFMSCLSFINMSFKFSVMSKSEFHSNFQKLILMTGLKQLAVPLFGHFFTLNTVKATLFKFSCSSSYQV